MQYFDSFMQYFDSFMQYFDSFRQYFDSFRQYFDSFRQYLRQYCQYCDSAVVEEKCWSHLAYSQMKCLFCFEKCFVTTLGSLHLTLEAELKEV